jgi:hypothetical protein
LGEPLRFIKIAALLCSCGYFYFACVGLFAVRFAHTCALRAWYAPRAPEVRFGAPLLSLSLNRIKLR